MRFLRKMNVQRNVYSLLFWQDAQVYLCTSACDVIERDQLRLLRARALVHSYLQPGSTLFPPSVRQTLREMLLRCLGDDLVRAAQDHVCKRLLAPWRIFMNQDKKRFAVTCLTERRRLTRTEYATNLLTTSSAYMRTHATAVTRHLFTQPRGNVTQAQLPPDSERRSWLAVKFTLDAFPERQRGLPVTSVSDSEMEHDEENLGSLGLKQLEVIERPDLVEERARLEFNRERRAVHNQQVAKAERQAKALRLQLKQAARLEVPAFFKPMRRGNVTHVRQKMK